MELQLIAEEIVDRFFITYAHQEQYREHHVFFTYNLPFFLSTNDRRVVVVRVMNILADTLKDFSIIAEENTVIIRSDI